MSFQEAKQLAQTSLKYLSTTFPIKTHDSYQLEVPTITWGMEIHKVSSVRKTGHQEFRTVLSGSPRHTMLKGGCRALLDHRMKYAAELEVTLSATIKKYEIGVLKVV